MKGEVSRTKRGKAAKDRRKMLHVDFDLSNNSVTMSLAKISCASKCSKHDLFIQACINDDFCDGEVKTNVGVAKKKIIAKEVKPTLQNDQATNDQSSSSDSLVSSSSSLESLSPSK